MGIPEGIPGHTIPKRIRQALRVGGKKWIAQVAAGVVVGASVLTLKNLHITAWTVSSAARARLILARISAPSAFHV